VKISEYKRSWLKLRGKRRFCDSRRKRLSKLNVSKMKKLKPKSSASRTRKMHKKRRLRKRVCTRKPKLKLRGRLKRCELSRKRLPQKLKQKDSWLRRRRNNKLVSFLNKSKLSMSNRTLLSIRTLLITI